MAISVSFTTSNKTMSVMIKANTIKDLVAGLPLDQKIVQYGPFVLNSQEEVYQALMDYQTQSNGFERAAGWQSEIGKSMMH
jgi:redox-sensitive bicupin YhaK (pirin superfamily)